MIQYINIFLCSFASDVCIICPSYSLVLLEFSYFCSFLFHYGPSIFSAHVERDFFFFQELKLRKQAIILLAYVASCGKSGFEILLKSVGPRGVNFLQIIIQVLASELDVEIAGCALARTLCKER